MSIELRKAETKLIDLSKKATITLEKKGLNGQIARVGIVFDISASMRNLYKKGTVQNAAERCLALAMNFDDNGAADVFAFGVKDHEIGEIDKSNFFEFVDREIIKKKTLEGGTRYAGVIRRLAEKYYPGAISVQKKGGFFGIGGRSEITVDASKYRNDPPCYIFFVTDGDNEDKEETREIIRQVSKLGIFFQFVGMGPTHFFFLQELDEMDGRYIDNANFFKINDLDKISDEELYDRILAEFPSWLKEARSKGIIL
ncbi:VWA domain-containing protein [Paenibacillus nasutitermitis]|uniref:VWFA domain-containing protein n=1 Tax=Paenibacillus nasutitermitis TaxID=1652958 RepID=A0A916ZIM5_9BACL|nr:VWA domain-containing protein [Paenibacillus nasutitermitis]GGD98457.1 hypothetical protein GCM10010911_66580 [Paenibacillus nasutitermitis]